MYSLSLLLAWRYLVKTKQERSISTMIKICFIGIALGTFSLTLVVAITRGFEQATHQHMQGIHAHSIMQAYDHQALAFDAIKKVLQNEFPEVISVSPTDQQYGIIQDTDGQINNLITLKGIDPRAEEQTTMIAEKIIKRNSNNFSLADIIDKNNVVIGEKLATRLQIVPGSHFQILFAPSSEQRSKTIHLDSATLIVGGIIKTGIEEFDSSLVLCSLPFLQELFPHAGISTVQLKLKNNIDEQLLLKKLRKRFNLDCYTWKELYPALLAALKLEKYASFFILTLIILVASMNIISLLFMQISQKRVDIAILQTLGAPFNVIKKIFFSIGFVVALCGCITGLIIAFIIGFLLQRYIRIELPDAYFTSHLPIVLEPSIFMIVFCVVMVISSIAALLSVRKIDETTIATTLRT